MKSVMNNKTFSETSTAHCDVCPRHCVLTEGNIGNCRARIAKNGEVISQSYGIITSYALDPIEKKPIYHFHPGKKILSVGSYGCNMHCLFCQNHGISQSDYNSSHIKMAPEQLVAKAMELTDVGNIGIAFTYNEPSIGWEFVRDTAKLAKCENLASESDNLASDNENLTTVMVTNGCFTEHVLEELLPYIDAFNIDLKCFTKEGYQSLGGDFETVKRTIKRASEIRHVEVTTLIVPGQNDDEAQMESETAWLAEISTDIPLHISRYFPNWKSDTPPTPIKTLQRLAEIARKHLANVHLGNVR